MSDAFQADPFVAGDWPRTFGLNLAVGWPLPVEPRAYQALADGLAALDPGLFVYPCAQTHITVLTLVSFKEHVEPAPEEQRALEALVPLVKEVVAPVVRGLGLIALEIGAPRLSDRAIYLPLADPSGAIARLRAAVLSPLRALSPVLQRCQPPQAVHSTLARFRAVPAADFPARFAAWAPGRALGPIRVDALLLTTETKPYMREGAVVATWPL